MDQDPDPDLDPDAPLEPLLSGARPPGRLARIGIPVVLAILMIGVAGLAMFAVGTRTGRDEAPVTAVGQRPAGVDLVMVGSAPASWDPARIGDAGSASILAQVWEGLTTFDVDAQVQPALAESWEVTEGGHRLTFTLRPGIAFSDGTPITARHVVDSWFRTIDPLRPSPLSGILVDIQGVPAYLAGQATAAEVGISADGDDRVVVEFSRPAAWFPAAAASPTLAIVPSDLPADAAGPFLPSGLAVSGGYVPVSQDAQGIRLEANEHYWAGRPAIGVIQHLTGLDTGPVDTFSAGDIDYVPIGSADASWIAYDPILGPQLRRSDALAVQYYGFDTTRAPFDDARIRQAFAWAVDWDRLVALSDPDAVIATSMVPAGIEGGGTGDFSPRHDPDAARAALADAGYPGGAGFPAVTLVTPGTTLDAAVVRELRRELGVEVIAEVMPFEEFTTRLDDDTPQMWALGWSADYPHPHDFLGLLLETGSPSNIGGWSDPEFDAAIDAAAATGDPLVQEAAYATAQAIVQDQVPVIPFQYSEDWALARSDLLGAGVSGLGIVRYAGMELAR
ncbi:MAG: hypothetical protein KF809_03760 [Chloroflexi bacterium]|nr:hypothetical protein [Chloroflexota bacterium]